MYAAVQTAANHTHAYLSSVQTTYSLAEIEVDNGPLRPCPNLIKHVDQYARLHAKLTTNEAESPPGIDSYTASEQQFSDKQAHKGPHGHI